MKKVLIIILSALELFLIVRLIIVSSREDPDGERIKSCSEIGERFLDEREKKIYRELLEHLQKITNGECTAEAKWFPLSEPYEKGNEGEISGLYNSFHKVDYMLQRYAPECYFWCRGINFMLYTSDEYSAYFDIAPEYRTEEYDVIDPDLLEKGRKAVENARAIAAKYEGKSDYDKIIGYVSEICDISDYDFDALREGYEDENLTPWRMVCIFDDDDSTNPVCAGYAAALEYLCGLGGIDCYYMSGKCDGEGHAWSAITLNGRQYYVDLTFCDGMNYSQSELKKYHPFILDNTTDPTPYGFTQNAITRNNAFYSSEYEYYDSVLEYYPEDIRVMEKRAYRPPARLVPYIVITAVLIAVCLIPKRKKAKDNIDNQEEIWYNDININ